jgi:NADH-quinone oxidoreductase subunit N
LLSAVIAAFYYLRIIKVIYFDAAKESYDKNISYGLQFSLIVSTVVVLFYFIDPSTLNTLVESITKNIK